VALLMLGGRQAVHGWHALHLRLQVLLRRARASGHVAAGGDPHCRGAAAAAGAVRKQKGT
jgi:hypothetical protein